MLKTGTVVDATLISAPSSTKNSTGTRDTEMHQTKKGNQWHFGMKAHIGVDADSGLVHTVTTTPANAHDITQAAALLHGQEQEVYADSGYRGVHKREEVQTQHPHVNWHIAMMPGQRRVMDKSRAINALKEQLEKIKASIRAKVKHPFRVIKRQFGHRKVRYRGPGQEHQPVAGDVCAVQPVDGAQANRAGGAGMSAPAAGAKARNRPNRAKNEQEIGIEFRAGFIM
jgi:IS5 family transposase